MKNILFAGVCTLAMFSGAIACADGTHHKQPADHAPLGVMGDHLHEKGEWMVGYRYRHIRTEGLRDGSSSVDNTTVLNTYGEVPTEMDMGMHMFEVMYGVSDDLTLMVMPQYMTMGMTHYSNHGHGHMHEHEIEGWGDTEVTGLYSVYNAKTDTAQHRAHVNLGLSLPTGSIDETFADHHASIYPLPYNMQLGSGTFDPILGITYNGASPDWSWGAQTLNYIRAGKNDNGYRQGNKYTATAWLARNLSQYASLSVRLEGEAWGDVSGRDTRLPLTAIAGADPDEQAGRRLLAHVGLNLLADAEGPLAGHRLAAEVGRPVYEHYSGPQPESDWRATLGWQWAF